MLVLRSSNIQNDELSFEDNVFVKKDIPAKIMVRLGDVLICVRNGSADLIGKSALLDKRTDGMTFGAFMAVYRSEIGVLVNYLFQSSILKKQVNEHLGATINQITNKSLNSFRIPLARDPRERNAIADSLCDVDAKIRSMVQLIAKKRDIRTGAMQRLLSGEARLAGFNEPWQLKRLGECLSEAPSYGINAAAVPFTDRLPRYIRITDITDDGRFSPSPLVCVRTDSRRYQLELGDLVFARTGASTGKTYLYDPADGELVYAGFLIRVRPDPKKLVSKFLAGVTTTRLYWNWVKTMSMRSGQPGINGQEYAQFEFQLPSVQEQSAISQVLSDMDAEISALEARLEKTRALKQGMMQALLTGRVRLPVQGEALDALEVAHA